MLQVFHADVAKVDRDVAYLVMTIHICCKRLFQMFYLFFQTYVANIFIWMLHIFQTYVANIISRYCICFAMAFQVFQVFLQVFQMHISSVSFVFRCMLQMLYLDV
jgi:hypothetical protein